MKKTALEIIIEDIEIYMSVSEGIYDDAGEAESLLKKAFKELTFLQNIMDKMKDYI